MKGNPRAPIGLKVRGREERKGTTIEFTKGAGILLRAYKLFLVNPQDIIASCGIIIKRNRDAFLRPCPFVTPSSSNIRFREWFGIPIFPVHPEGNANEVEQIGQHLA